MSTSKEPMSDKAAKGLVILIASFLSALSIGLIMNGFGIDKQISWGVCILLFLASCGFLSWIWKDEQ
jgi:hypothetical protein